ncbi:MAG TPA: HAD family hydrolase, partial [Candidatus Dormibacteraeota bacterium]
MSTPKLSARPALLFDLDGTLIDSVYQHVLAWREALHHEGLDLSVWRIHRRIGMSGGLFLRALERELGSSLKEGQAERLREAHADGVLRRLDQIRPLPGSRELLAGLTAMRVPWAIATSGSEKTA